MPRNTKGLRRGGAGRPRGSLNKATADVRALAQSFLSRPEYLASRQARIDRGAAPQLEVLLHYYAHGKPKETVDLTADVPPFVVKIEVDDPSE